MRVLVTGAQGCIGAWCVKQLVERGVDVVVFDREESMPRLSLIATAEQLAKVKTITGLIEDTARVKSIIRDEEITHVLHLAAVLMPYCQVNPVTGAKINVIGTMNVFEGARDAGRQVRVSYASSAAVWGPGELYEDRPLNERDPLRPGSYYGIFKRANEDSAKMFYLASGISSIGLRPWVVYGVGRDSGSTAGPTLAMKAVAAGETYQIDITGNIDLQYVEDVAATFVQTLFSQRPGAFVYNMAGDVVSIPEFIATLSEIRPGADTLVSCGGNRIPVANRMNNAALAKAFPKLQKTPLKEGMEKTVSLFEKLAKEGRLPG